MLDKQLLIVTGKGGVGKSAVSAALALLATRRGQRVLAIGLADDLGLALHLGVERLSYQAHELRPGLFALGVNLGDSLDEYLRLMLKVPRITRFGPLTRAFGVLAATAPGIREIVSIGKPLYEVRTGNWDLVVVDAPPTGQIGSYLGAASTVASLVPSGRVRRQAGLIQEILSDSSRTGLIAVVLGEELPVIETTKALAAVSERGWIHLDEVVANRVIGPLGISAENVAALEPGPNKEAAALHRALHTQQRKWLAKLEPSLGLPYLFGLLTPMEVAARLADELDSR